MNRQATVVGVLAVAVIAIWNSWVFLDWSSKDASGNQAWWSPPQDIVNSPSKQEPQLWLDIKKTLVAETPDGGTDPEFDEAVLAAEGKPVELPGVGFLLSSGLEENGQGDKVVTEFLLLPGNGGVALCCGLAPIPKYEFSVLVECPNAPFRYTKTDPKTSAMFVRVVGVLRLRKDNSISSLYTLEDASIEFIDIEEVLPPNTKNLCLDRPMVL